MEFVVLSNFVDGDATTFADGTVLVPCRVTAEAASSEIEPVLTPRWEYIYDGRTDVKDTSVEAVREAIERIDQLVTVLAHSYGVAARWFPKYIECTQRRISIRRIDGTSRKAAEATFGALQALPPTTRAAVARSVHWLQRGTHQINTIDRFLYIWFALESLLVCLFESSNEVALSVQGAGRTKAEKRAARNQLIRSILEQELEGNPVQAVTRAYFDAVVSLRGQAEAVLKAVLGENDAMAGWPYGKSDDSPSKLRAAIVHHGRAPHELYVEFPVERVCARLERLTHVVLARALSRSWNGSPMNTIQRDFSMTFAFGDGFTNSNSRRRWEPHGDFEITHELLARKGLL